MYYRQCSLERGNQRTTTWIPETFANLGKYIKLKEGNVWEDGWKVVGVYHRLDYRDVLRLEDQYKHTRDVSDV